ncbi:MAG: PspC domain-containing protein [Firmicutes bacterium]|nr:PspC domain-containing protein [Bacillota bacterium]
MENNKKLYRSTKNRMLGGVCGGFAEYLGLDVTIVRLLYLILSIFTACFPGLILYILCLFVMPNEPGFSDVKPETRSNDGDYTDV